MRDFFKTTILGGLAVVAPIAILIFIFTWLYEAVAGLIKPLTDWAMANIINHAFVANIIVLMCICIVCFLIGFLVKTEVGKLLHTFIERVLKFAPFYNIIKETVSQFTRNKKSPFSSVAIVDLFGNGTFVTAFVTDKTSNIYTELILEDYSEDKHNSSSVHDRFVEKEFDATLITIFIPTAPNPTSGLIYHVPQERVKMIDAPVEDTMRSILSCGSGSSSLLNLMNK